jgi:glyoxylase-like metal-dependent hydrolase (beta-lactamase superfamily II)
MPRLPDVQQFLSSGGKRVYRLPCKVFPEFTGRVYLVLGAGPPTLVDVGSGQGESTRNILAGIETVRRDFGESVHIEQIERILITHGHSDHYGGLPDMLALTEAEVCIHPLDGRLITAAHEFAVIARGRLRRLVRQAGTPEDVATEFLTHYWKMPGGLPSLPVNVDVLAGDEVDGMRVLHTPGHSPGHVCLLVDDLLLCGDHVLARTMPQLWPESLRAYKGLGHYLESLRVVRETPRIRIALPGHEAIIEDLYERINAIERSQHRRVGHVISVFDEMERPLTIWDISSRSFPQTAGFFGLLAFMDTAARVEYLHERGRVRLANLEQIADDGEAAWEYVKV